MFKLYLKYSYFNSPSSTTDTGVDRLPSLHWSGKKLTVLGVNH